MHQSTTDPFGDSAAGAFAAYAQELNLRRVRSAALLVGGIFLFTLPMDLVLVPDRVLTFAAVRLCVAVVSFALFLLCARVSVAWSWPITIFLYLTISLGMAAFALLYPEGAALINRTIFGFIFLLAILTIWPWSYSLIMSVLMSAVSLAEQILRAVSPTELGLNAMYLAIACTAASMASFMLFRVRRREFAAVQVLQQANLQLEKITGASPNLIYVFDLELQNMVYANRALTGYMGYTLEQVQGLGKDLLSNVVHPDDLPALLEHLRRFAVLGDEQVAEITQRVRSADGRWRWQWQREIIFKRDASGRPVQVLGVAQDITELREQTKRLEQAQAVFEQELGMARQIQQSLLPLSPPVIPGARLFSEYIALAQVGGDFIDYSLAGDGSVGIFIGDASGHGVRAALVGSMAKMALETLRPFVAQPVEMFVGLNRAIYGKTHNNFVVGCYAHFEPKSNQLRYALAGSPAPFLFRARQPVAQLEGAGKPLGIFETMQWREHRLDLQSGDRVLFVTDGILECRSAGGQDMTDEDMLALLATLSEDDPEAVIAAIISKLRAFMGTRGFEDDVTLILLAVD